jgi:hypothetical protein
MWGTKMFYRKLVVIFFILSLTSLFAHQVPCQDISPVILSYVELVTIDEDSAAATWVTNLPSDTRVQWGETEALGEESIVDESVLNHMGRLTGLDEGTTYYYRVGSGGRWSDISILTTIEPPNGELKAKFAIVADSHLDMDGSNQASGAMYEDSPRLLRSLITELNQDSDLDFVMTLGDLTNGAEEDYIEFTNTMDGLDVPWYPLLGNWDKNEAGWGDYYLNHTGWTETYYNELLGGFNLIVLDSAVEGQVNGSIDNLQLEWLENTLDENFGTPTIIFIHHLVDRTDIFGIDEVSKQKLETLISTRPYILSLTSGHIHQNSIYVNFWNQLYVTIGSVVQYPIGYCMVNLYEEGYSQSFHKIESELATSEESRLRLIATNGASADDEYLGTVEERNFGVSVPSNQAPNITSVSVSPNPVAPDETATVTVIAYDPDDDELSFIYDVDEGEIEGNGPAVIYHAPGYTGTFELSVMATDGDYYSAVETVDITVGGPGVNSAPVITRIWTSQSVIKTGETIQVEVSATDNDDDRLTYKYEVTGGSISGHGEKVEWRAPDQAGDYTITVTVSDGEATSTERSVTITVIETLDVDSDEGLPGFETIIVLIAMTFCIYIVRVRNKK